MKIVGMRSYFAKQGNQVHEGGWLTVLEWSKRRIQFNPAPIKIFTARGGDTDAHIIREITTEGERTIPGGRVLSLKALLSGKEK